jgi:Type I site-specific restriction-modification system, R (restriction) subunit and related helicases
MTKTNTKEIGFEEFIENELVEKRGYRIRSPREHYNKQLAMDTELVLEFVRSTQPDEWEKVEAQYGADAPERFLARLDEEIASQGLLNVLRNGVKDRGVTIRLAYAEPQTGMNPEAQKDFDADILSVVRQLKYSEQNENSIDVVLFINGLPLFTAELTISLPCRVSCMRYCNIRLTVTERDAASSALSHALCVHTSSADEYELSAQRTLRYIGTRAAARYAVCSDTQQRAAVQHRCLRARTAAVENTTHYL